jgi:hypothetical protein
VFDSDTLRFPNPSKVRGRRWQRTQGSDYGDREGDSFFERSPYLPERGHFLSV